MIERRIKLLPVLDETGRCVAPPGRSALLAALARTGETWSPG